MLRAAGSRCCRWRCSARRGWRPGLAAMTLLLVTYGGFPFSPLVTQALVGERLGHLQLDAVLVADPDQHAPVLFRSFPVPPIQPAAGSNVASIASSACWSGPMNGSVSGAAASMSHSDWAIPAAGGRWVLYTVSGSRARMARTESK